MLSNLFVKVVGGLVWFVFFSFPLNFCICWLMTLLAHSKIDERILSLLRFLRNHLQNHCGGCCSQLLSGKVFKQMKWRKNKGNATNLLKIYFYLCILVYVCQLCAYECRCLLHPGRRH